jgi:hypothetical protein
MGYEKTGTIGDLVIKGASEHIYRKMLRSRPASLPA